MSPWRWRRKGRGSQVSCAEVGRVVQSFLDGELSGEVAASVGRHLDDCRRCGLDADLYRRLKESLQRADSLPVDEEALQRLRHFGARLAAGEAPEVEAGDL